MLNKLIIILALLLLLLSVTIMLISINHPIILKWISGSARLIGRPTNAVIYTDGRVNNNIKAYKVNTYWNGGAANYYILHFMYADTKNTTEVISINLRDNYVGKPSSISNRDYDIILGHLFQSDVGVHFSQFTDDMKGYDFNPKLMFKDSQIKLSIPTEAKKLQCDSIRIEFIKYL